MRRNGLFLAAAFFVAAPVFAQSPFPPIRDPYLTISYGTASRSQEAHQQRRFSLYNEDVAFDVLHRLDRAAFIDIGAGARVWRGLFMGLTYTGRVTETRAGAITAFVPHPVYYDAFRSAEGTANGLEHREHAVHIQAMWRFEPARSLQIGVFGGPTLFTVSHDLVEDFTVTEADGTFMQVNLGEPTRRRDSQSGFGGHGGVDAMYRIAGPVGVGGMVRYSHGTPRHAVPGDRAVPLTAGGLDAGVRVRIGF